MAVLGILTCEILEREIAFLVGNDRDFCRVTVIDDARAQHLIETIEEGGIHAVNRIPHLSTFNPEGAGCEVLIRVLEFGLHRHRDILRKRLDAETRRMDRFVDALLLGYGQCGGALSDPIDVVDVHGPVLYPRDGAHPVADCVGLYLGGTDAYYREQCRVPGTYYLTPGWCRHWRDMFLAVDDARPPAISSMLCHRVLRGYKRLLIIHSPVLDGGEMRASARELSGLSGLGVEEREGSLQILQKSYQEAKRALDED